MTRLRLKDRRVIREVARKAWVDSKQEGDIARLLFQQDDRVAGQDPATIILWVQLAIALWKWWKELQIAEPSVVASFGEPIELETEDDD